MGYFQVRYDSRVVNYDRIGFIRLATGLFGVSLLIYYVGSGKLKWVMGISNWRKKFKMIR